MKAIKKYLKLRKQNDSVKLITLLFLVLIIFIFFSVSEICKFYQEIHTKTEYILTSADNLEKVKLKLQKIKEMDGNITAGIEKDYYITFDDGEKSLLVKEVSPEYLRECYSINDDLFYLNNSAFLLIDNKQNQFTLPYQKDDKKLSGRFKLQDNLNDSMPFALKCADSVSVYGKAETITVSAMFENADISGETSKSLEGLGFEIKNKSDIALLKYNENLFFVKIKYNIFIIFLTLLFIMVMLKILVLFNIHADRIKLQRY